MSKQPSTLTEENKKQIVKALNTDDSVKNITKLINAVKDNLGPDKPIIVPSGNRVFPVRPKTGRVEINYANLPWKPNPLLPILSDAVNRKKASYGMQLEEILKNTPTLDFVIYNSNLSLLLSNTRNYTCLKAFDLLRYYFYVFMICVDSNDIAESNEQRNQFLASHATFRKLAEDRFDEDYIFAKSKFEFSSGTAKGVIEFVSDVTIAATNYYYDLVQCYEMTILNFFSTNNRHKNGIPLEQRRNLYLLRNIPAKDHVGEDCLKILGKENKKYHKIRNRSTGGGGGGGDDSSKLITSISTVIKNLNIGSEPVKIKAVRFKEGIYVAVNELHRDTEMLINFTESSQYYNPEHPQKYVPFVYWTYEDVLNLVHWLEFMEENVDAVEFMKDVEAKLMGGTISPPELIHLEDPTQCEFDTMHMDILSEQETITVKYSSDLFLDNKIDRDYTSSDDDIPDLVECPW